MIASSPCPDPQTLERLALGRMPPDEVERLAQHCERCERCVRALHALDARDTLVEAVAAQRTATDRPPDATADRLMERLEALRPLAPASEVTAHSAAGNTPPAPPRGRGPDRTEEVYDFLAPPLAPGELGRLGGYRVLRVLGAGGMGVVFRAEDPRLERPVALKVMRPALAADPAARQRFVREAKAAAALEHENVVTIYQVGEDRGVPFIAMQLLKGVSLEERLQRPGTLSVPQVLRLGRQIARGLAVAHARGLVHRDVKPANLWIEPEQGGRVKVLDFGLARAVADDAHLTRTGAVIGTPAYMAPEQARGEAVDARADLFSLGCVLYRLATGEAPFAGKDSLAVLMAAALAQPRPPREYNPELPEVLSDLILRLLAKKPGERPRSAQQVAEALQAIERRLTVRDAVPVATPVATPVAPLPQPPPTRRRPWGWIAVAGGLFAAAVLLAGIVVIIRDKEGKEVARVNVPEGGSAEIREQAKPRDAGGARPAPAKDAAVQYLSDAHEFNVRVSDGRFGRSGNLGFMAGNPPRVRILVNGKESPNGIAMCPRSNDFAAADYAFYRRARVFMAAVALDDAAGAPGRPPGEGRIPTPLTFSVIGDAKVLWTSKPVDTAGVVQECSVDVSEVEIFELHVTCPGSGINAYSVWLEPRVVFK